MAHRHHPDSEIKIEICEVCAPWPPEFRFLAAHLSHLEHLMTQLGSNQERLDADVQALTTSLQGLEDEIASLKDQPGAENLDFSSLDGLVSRMQADLPTPPATSDPTPVTEPDPTPTPVAEPDPVTAPDPSLNPDPTPVDTTVGDGTDPGSPSTDQPTA